MKLQDANDVAEHRSEQRSDAQPAAQAFVSPRDRRRFHRHLVSKPIYAIPVLPDKTPAQPSGAEGLTLDVSEGGLKFQISDLDCLPSKQLLVGVQADDGVLYYATVESRHAKPTPRGLQVGALFATGACDLLRTENLAPTFNPANCRFETGLPIDTLTRWVELGVFRPIMMDRVSVCPQCQSVVSVRSGCRVCGSVRLHTRPLIHHFACAHVGYVSDFERDGAMVCPKCRTRNLIVGADYEHLSGPHHCLDCDWSDTELDQVAQCLRCAYRFPLLQAGEEDLIGYHVNRLDPLDLVQNA